MLNLISCFSIRDACATPFYLSITIAVVELAHVYRRKVRVLPVCDRELGARHPLRVTSATSMSTKRKAGPAKSTPSTKRAKVAETTTKSTINFHGAGDIRRALQSQSQDELRECASIHAFGWLLLKAPNSPRRAAQPVQPEAR